MQVDYTAFDKVYEQLRAKGCAWNTPDQLARTTELLQKFLDSAAVPLPAHVLELGCGAGDLTLWLAEKGFDVTGIDISQTAINWARERFAARGLRGEFRVGSVLDLSEFQDDSFDIVLDGHCLHCIIGTDRQIFLSNAHRVLKPKGVFHVATMCGEIRDPSIRALFDPETRCIIKDGVAIRQIEEAPGILREIEMTGFRVLQWEIAPPVTVDDQADLLVNATK